MVHFAVGIIDDSREVIGIKTITSEDDQILRVETGAA
jgi:hypothetical protein